MIATAIMLQLQCTFSTGACEKEEERCRRWRSNPSGKCSQERLTRGTVTSTKRRAAHPSGCARCGAGAGCSAIKHQSICGRVACTVPQGSSPRCPRRLLPCSRENHPAASRACLGEPWEIVQCSLASRPWEILRGSLAARTGGLCPPGAWPSGSSSPSSCCSQLRHTLWPPCGILQTVTHKITHKICKQSPTNSCKQSPTKSLQCWSMCWWLHSAKARKPPCPTPIPSSFGSVSSQIRRQQGVQHGTRSPALAPARSPVLRVAWHARNSALPSSSCCACAVRTSSSDASVILASLPFRF